MRSARQRLSVVAATAGLVLVATLSGGCTRSTVDTSKISPTDGAGLVNAVCSQCHPLQRVENTHMDRSGWTTTVSRMQSHGLQVTDQQKQSIIDYLTKRDGGS